MQCPKCGADMVKNGRRSDNRRQYYLCKPCGKTVTEWIVERVVTAKPKREKPVVEPKPTSPRKARITMCVTPEVLERVHQQQQAGESFSRACERIISDWIQRP